MIALDTNALIFWVLDSDRLSVDLRNRLNVEDVIYTPISLWEIALKQSRGNLRLPWSAREIAKRLERVRNLRCEPADAELWIASAELDWEHRDPADRLIVSLAMRHECDLASTDERIRGFYGRTVR